MNPKHRPLKNKSLSTLVESSSMFNLTQQINNTTNINKCVINSNFFINKMESCLWLNRAINVFYHHFRDAKSEMFETILKKVLKAVYNKNWPTYLKEIEVTKVIIGGKAPELLSFTLLDSKPDEWLCDVDISFRGTVDLSLNTTIILNFRKRNIANIPLEVKAHVKSLNGKCWLFFCKSEGKGWYGFVNTPIVDLDLDPILGKSNKLFLKVFPKVKKFI